MSECVTDCLLTDWLTGGRLGRRSGRITCGGCGSALTTHSIAQLFSSVSLVEEMEESATSSISSKYVEHHYLRLLEETVCVCVFVCVRASKCIHQ